MINVRKNKRKTQMKTICDREERDRERARVSEPQIRYLKVNLKSMLRGGERYSQRDQEAGAD